MVKGREGHVAYPHLALNPISHISKIINAMDDIVFDEGSAHFDPTSLEFSNIHAGQGAKNVIPDTATAFVSVRFSDEHTTTSIQDKLQEVINHLTHDTNYDVTLTMSEGGDAFLTKDNPTVDEFCRAAETVTGYKPNLSTSGGTSDARFIKNYCPVFEMGLINKTIHQTDECLSIKDLETLVEIYTQFLQTYFK